MATYLELEALRNNSGLLARVRVAVWVAAETVRTELDTTPNHANRLVWARDVFTAPEPQAQRMYWALLATNKDQTIAQITSATDAQIQTAVDAAVDLFAV